MRRLPLVGLWALIGGRVTEREMYHCCICHQHARRTLIGVLRHMREVHPHFESRVVCGLDGCVATPASFQGLRQHIYRYHRNLLDVTSNETSVDSPEYQRDGEDPDLQVDDSGTDSTQDDTRKDLCSMPPPPSTRIVGAQFILKIRDGRGLTQVTTDGILHDMNVVLTNTVEVIEGALFKKIEDLGIVMSERQIAELRTPFSDQTLINPFNGLETEYKQEKFISEHFNHVMPVQRILGREQIVKSGRMKEIAYHCYDVPLLQSLQALLNNDCVLEQIFNSHNLSSGKMRDYCDGEQFRKCQLFQDDPCALQIRLYYDDLEVCNALGSKTKKHKLGLFYFSLGNIEPKFRSALHTIQLLTVIKTELIGKFGINEVLKPFMEDICELESDVGVTFSVDGTQLNFRGTLTVVSADNPAACLLGGYKSLHSAHRKCRSCMAVDIDMQTKFTEEKLQLRIHDTHASHVADLDGPMHNHIATTYGVTEQSLLNSSRYFHVVDGLVPDIMHDILEGTTQLTLKCLLQYLIQDCGYFTLNNFNERMTSFNYGSDDARNKPSEISRQTLSSSDSNALKQSATQAWCLARFFPLLVGDMVPEGNERWHNFLNLLLVMEYALAPVIASDEVGCLEIMIEEFLEEFVSLYPGKPLVPKMHYLVHVPSWIRIIVNA